MRTLVAGLFLVFLTLVAAAVYVMGIPAPEPLRLDRASDSVPANCYYRESCKSAGWSV